MGTRSVAELNARAERLRLPIRIYCTWWPDYPAGEGHRAGFYCREIDYSRNFKPDSTEIYLGNDLSHALSALDSLDMKPAAPQKTTLAPDIQRTGTRSKRRRN